MRGSQKRVRWLATSRAACCASVVPTKKSPISLVILMSRSIFMASSGSFEPLRMRVHDVLIGTRARDQREPGTLRQPHGECGGRRQRDQQRDADRGALLHHLVARAAGDQHVAAGE